MRVVLLNGPPRSGKDSLGRAIASRLVAGRIFKFATRLKDMTHSLYDIDAHAEEFESVKDEPNILFRGLTPRQAYIAVSEKLMKPMHGERVFGEMLLEDLFFEEEMNGLEIAVVTDSGFEPEAQVLLGAYGSDKVYLVRLHRPGTDFKNDSRGFIDLDLPESNVLVLQNEGALDSIQTLGDYVVEKFGLA